MTDNFGEFAIFDSFDDRPYFLKIAKNSWNTRAEPKMPH